MKRFVPFTESLHIEYRLHISKSKTKGRTFMSNQKKKVQFRGKQILLLGLVALVITAGYYRWTVESDKLISAVPTSGDAVQVNGEGQDNSDSNVQNNGETGSGEFSKLKQERDLARSQSAEEWTKIKENSDASQESKREAESKITKATENAEKERKIEMLVLSKGFADCIAYVDENSVAVTVKGGEIDGSKVAQIKDIIVGETNVPVKNIKITAL